MHPGAQYSTRQRFPPSYSCITPVDNACAFFKQASPEGRHLFPPVLTLLIHSKTFFIDTKLSLGLEGGYLQRGEAFSIFFLLNRHAYFIIYSNSLDFYSFELQ